MTALKRIALASLLVAAAACGGSSSSPTTPTAVVGPQTALFEGTLDPGGYAFYSFTVDQTGNASVMLASVSTSTAPNTTAAVTLGLALGTPLGTDCSITSALTASPGLTSPLVNSLTPGIYCARVYDIGQLRSTVNFAVRIVHT
jgi:hypothetical protein